MSNRVFLGLPTYDARVHIGTMSSVLQASSQAQFCFESMALSLLAANFNRLWCRALSVRKRERLTHFCLLHADVEIPKPHWLDHLIAEQDRVGADVLSGVIAVKDGSGLTSTGLMDAETLDVHRLSLETIDELPVTFSAADCGAADKILAVNSGLLLCKFTDEWVEQVEDAHFECRDEIRRRIAEDGSTAFETWSLSEDWNFSLAAHRLGLKVFATSLLPIRHHGSMYFDNRIAQ